MLGPQDFLGEWRLLRRIDDRRLAQQGRLDGVAWFTRDADGLRCREEGSLRLGDGRPLTARSETLWRWTAEGVDVRFADGRPFHSFVPLGRRSGTDHPCGADLYRVTNDFTSWPGWSSTWIVTGPAKDYTMRSHYVRT